MVQQKKVICYIQAFDCEKTIATTMQSIVDQTYKNWICFILSNGNENTIQAPNWSFDVIKAFAMRDSRFVVLNKKKNDLDMYVRMLYHLSKSFPGSYICSLDSDDVYKNDFFERAVTLAESKNLDIVACGTDIVLKQSVDSSEETLLKKREIQNDLVIYKNEFTDKFCIYKPFFNEMWGKLYRTDLFDEKCNEAYMNHLCKGYFLPDTLFTIDTLSRCNKIGILSGTSHKFYQYMQRPTSNATFLVNAGTANYFWNNLQEFKYRNRFSVFKTFDIIINFLSSNGKISSDLNDYMQAILFGWMNDIYNRVLLYTTDEKKLCHHVENLILNTKFEELMFYKGSEKYHNLREYQARIDFCVRLRNMLIAQKVIRNRLVSKRHKRYKFCTSKTAHRIDKLVSHLDQILAKMIYLQKKENCNAYSVS